MKKEKGITLVALVVTIIILLILAGITITLTLGDKGIINMAKEAGKNYQNAQEYEQTLLGNLTNEATNIIGSDGTQGSANMGKIRILEQGTIDTGTIASRNYKEITINFQNTYTKENNAYLWVYKVEELSGTIAIYNDMDRRFYPVEGPVTFNIYNAANPGTGSARLYYWVIGGLEEQ